MTEFPAGDGIGNGYLAIPASNEGPGVLVLHAWWGLNEFFKGLCDRLASQGFVAFAPDLYGHGSVASTIEEAKEQMSKLEFEQAKKIAMGAVEFLHGHPAVSSPVIGAVGFSMGAAWAIQLSVIRPETVVAVVLFYGMDLADFTVAKAAYLGHFAENDGWEDMEWVRKMEGEMKAAGREVTLYTYPNAGHWFVEENRPDVYDESAAELAWERTLTFLRSQLSQPKA